MEEAEEEEETGKANHWKFGKIDIPPALIRILGDRNALFAV